MRQIFYISILSAAITVCLAGCHTLERIYLKEPTKAPLEEPKPAVRVPAAGNEQANSVADMLGRIKVILPQGRTQTDISVILEGCLSFLAGTFGPPVYQGQVILQITDDPADNAFIIWNEKSDLERKITLNHYNVLKPIWHHYLVHELFHAFYQSSDFLKAYPDSIIEGMAIYAQYRYQHRKLTNDRILDRIHEETDGLRTYCTQNGFDFDFPFQSYGEEERKYAYLVSGLVFFKQDPDDIDAIIQSFLRTPPLSQEKMHFDQVVARYGLIVDDQDFHRIEKPTIALPNPRKVDTDPYQGIFPRSIPVESRQIEPDDLNRDMLQHMFDMVDQ